VHEVMGLNCGWLTAATAKAYRQRLSNLRFVPELRLGRGRKDVHAVFLPELSFDLDAEAKRLGALLEEQGSVNVFVSEGAGVDTIVKELEARGETLTRDAFGHVKLDSVNVGDWFAKQFGKRIGAQKTLVQKSGYFARAAAANADDLRLIKSMVDLAVDCGLRGDAGVIGHDEDKGGVLRAIEFTRIKGGKPFDVEATWFNELLREIGQPKGKPVAVAH
jgi:diphosphate-dependent phosphofructokinase